MEPIDEEYREALRQLLRAAKRFRNRIELFRNTDIGAEIWEAINAGSRVMTALEYTEQMNDFLIKELRHLGAIKREQLDTQDRKLDKVLNELGANVMSWVVDVSGRENTRVSHITIAYTRESGLTTKQMESKVETALDRTILNEPAGIIYASNLKFYLAEEGLYGIALQDSRDRRFDWLLAGVIAKGRLLIHLREEAGLSKREPKKKKVKHAEI